LVARPAEVGDCDEEDRERADDQDGDHGASGRDPRQQREGGAPAPLARHRMGCPTSSSRASDSSSAGSNGLPTNAVAPAAGAAARAAAEENAETPTAGVSRTPPRPRTSSSRVGPLSRAIIPPRTPGWGPGPPAASIAWAAVAASTNRHSGGSEIRISSRRLGSS